MTELAPRTKLPDYDSDGRPIAEFGNERVMKIPRSAINVLPQIRTEFDPDKLQDLADSMPLAEDIDGLMHELMEPVIEGVHTAASARRYLSEFNLANGTQYELKDLISYKMPGGTRYVIHIAGERRLRAADILIEKHGYSPESLILSMIHENISYIEALPKQFVENNARVNPSQEDEARAMRRYINMMRVIKPKYTQADCAKAFVVHPDKVGDAMTFTDYPPSMQTLARDYPFSWVIEAKDIYELWLQYYQENRSYLPNLNEPDMFAIDDPVVGMSANGATTWTASNGTMFFESPEDVATYEVETCFMRIIAERLARRTAQRDRKNRDVRLMTQLEEIKKMMQNEVAGIGELALPTLDDEQDAQKSLAELFSQRRKVAASGLFEAIMRGLWLLDARGDLSPEYRRRLGQYSAQFHFPQLEKDEEDIALTDKELVAAR